MLKLPFVGYSKKMPKGAICGKSLDELAFKIYGEHGHVQEMLEIAQRGRPLKSKEAVATANNS